MGNNERIFACALVFLTSLAIGSCAPQSRMGMVVDQRTGKQIGSVVERSFVVDATQFRDPRLKLRIRNTSGDPLFNLGGMSSFIERSYQRKGYQEESGGEYGLLVDVNVVYSGQVSRNLMREFSFLGGTAAGLAAYGATRGGIETAAGVLAGATLGSIVGRYQRQETYIVVAEVSLAVIDKKRGSKEAKIVFGKTQDKKDTKSSEFRGFRDRASTKISVFAGGRNVDQGSIAQSVRDRFRSILADII